MFEKIILYDLATHECDIYKNVYRFDDEYAIWDDDNQLYLVKISKEEKSKLNLYKNNGTVILCDTVNNDIEMLKSILHLIKMKSIYELLKAEIDNTDWRDDFNFNVDQLL
ncbi:hypothetical protein [Niallia taxi]|uniref:hypothetical protein n=1 Tax=Niallia taxi TaxID=2499688 RepID=UPI0015F77406|nr:hypothetical protein [Niallia taxi]